MVEQRSLPNINRLAVERKNGNWRPHVPYEQEGKGNVGNFTTPEYKLKNIISQSKMDLYNGGIKTNGRG
jgi:hypothetical protein